MSREMQMFLSELNALLLKHGIQLSGDCCGRINAVVCTQKNGINESSEIELGQRVFGMPEYFLEGKLIGVER
jgi:hypothetical protein